MKYCKASGDSFIRTCFISNDQLYKYTFYESTGKNQIIFCVYFTPFKCASYAGSMSIISLSFRAIFNA
ncbi:hypothetical protein DXA95_05110 [Odoribacter sp. OF09-27XD]|nr:hypothetical protein DXA95_05110 [Odoribacter sp. OF09-27XD]